MPEGAETVIDERGNPYAQLGPKFWVPWSLAMAGVAVAFAAAVWAMFPHMGALPVVAMFGVAVIVFTLAMIGLCMVPMRILQKRGVEGRMRPAYRRYMWRFLPAMFGYVICLIGAMVYSKEANPEGLLAWLVGLAPSLPVLLAIRAVTLLPREENDEYLRERLYRVYAWATGGMLAVCTILGFLDLFKVLPHVELWAAFPIWAICMGIAQCMPARRPE